MTFPIKMNVPQYSLQIPSTKEKVQFRPFLVGEQKSMMLALATQDTDTIVASIKMLIESCSNGKVSANTLAPFDLEYLFLQLRSKSIGENVILTTHCSSCQSEFQFKVDVSLAEVDFSTSIPNKIQLSSEIGVQMRYPTLSENIKLYEDKSLQDTRLIDTTIDCIENVWNSEDLISVKDYPRESIVKFVDTLTVEQMKKLSDFILLMPSVRFIKESSCPHCKGINNILIEGLENFFG